MSLELKPILRLRSYWFDRTDTLYGILGMTVEILQQKAVPETGLTWKKTEEGFKFRAHRVSEEEINTLSKEEIIEKRTREVFKADEFDAEIEQIQKKHNFPK